MATTKNQLVAVLEQDKVTAGAVRYKETDDSPAQGMLGQVYVSKVGIRVGMGEVDAPTKIRVTIESA